MKKFVSLLLALMMALSLVACGSKAAAREKGLVRLEGKDYVMQDGDVVEFFFNVSKSAK